jgi:polar amino acid transport system substrate-binding protein
LALGARRLGRVQSLGVLLVAWAGLSSSVSAQLTVAVDPPAAVQASHDIRSIVSDRVLRVAISRFDIPPFHRHRANGTIVGREAELAYRIAGALGVKTVFVDDATTFDEVVKLVADGRADIGINALSQTFGAVTSVRFSVPYMTLRHALLYNRTMVAQEANGAPPEDILREFRGKIGIIAASPFVGFADQNFPWAPIVQYQKWDDATQGLRSGEVDALYNNEFEVRRVLKEDPALHVRYGAAVMKDKWAFLAIAVCDSCTKLQEFINYFIVQTRATLSIKELLSASESD